MVLDPRRFVLRTDCEKIESEINVAKSDIPRITAEIARGASRPEALTGIFNRITFSENALADCLERRTQLQAKEQPIITLLRTTQLTPTPIIFGTPIKTGIEQPQRKPLSLKQLAIIGGVVLLLL